MVKYDFGLRAPTLWRGSKAIPITNRNHQWETTPGAGSDVAAHHGLESPQTLALKDSGVGVQGSSGAKITGTKRIPSRTERKKVQGDTEHN
jgi:hypothetical protein